MIPVIIWGQRYFEREDPRQAHVYEHLYGTQLVVPFGEVMES